MNRSYSHIEETRREFIREKRRHIKAAKKSFKKLRSGCALSLFFGGTYDFQRACRQMGLALKKMDEITKPLR